MDATTQKSDIVALIQKAENDFSQGQTNKSKFVQFNMKDDLDKIDAYYSSRHTTGSTDSMDREKPFFNIVTAAVNIWYRATDLDRKNIKIKATRRKQDIAAFLATVHLQKWMNGNKKDDKKNFGQFLNSWGRALAKYGSSVVKFVEKDGMLFHSVIPWSRLIVDPIDFDGNPVIEKLQFTPAQLRKNKNYDQDMVEDLIKSHLAARTDHDGQTKDTKYNYIEIYEVHGEMERSYLTGNEEDENEFDQQMHVVSYVVKNKEGDYDAFTLYSGKEDQSPYMITHLIEEDDQTLAVGAVQNLFDAQWMVNHSVKAIKDQLDVASKLIFQTSDGNFVGQNALAAIEQGDILIHAKGEPLTQVSNNSHDIGSLQNFQAMWQQLGNQINGLSEAMLGKNAPAGSAWRQTEALLQESYSLFEVMTENKGFYVEQMLRRFIIPFLKKQMDNSDEIAATLEKHDLDKLDTMFLPNEAIRRYNERATEEVLNGKLPEEFNPQTEEAQLRGQLNELGNTRFFRPGKIPTKTWKELFEDLEWESEIDITAEQKDVQAVMDTLNTALKMFVAATPQQLADPNFKLVFNKILEQSAVISPIEISSLPSNQPAPLPPPQNMVPTAPMPAGPTPTTINPISNGNETEA